MTEALIRAYVKAGTHLDAYGYEQFLLPEIAATKVWVPERQAEMTILDRLWWPEKYPWMRLVMGHADPRQAGVGNCVNCGVAMWMMPVGAMNAGDPEGAYAEATALGLAHNESFAVEAAGVMAACYAAAFAPGATVADVLAATRLGRDGTGAAMAACIGAAERAGSVTDFIAKARSAVAPFDQRTGHAPDDKPLADAEPASDLGKPSRLASIEELPVAVAALVFVAGDFHQTVRAGVFYGRDCDSIAGMACGLFGGLHGSESLPATLRAAVDRANRRDLTALSAAFMPVVSEALRRDADRLTRRLAALR
jgi:ADP-ribosylglycohydrolase